LVVEVFAMEPFGGGDKAPLDLVGHVGLRLPQADVSVALGLGIGVRSNRHQRPSSPFAECNRATHGVSCLQKTTGCTDGRGEERARKQSLLFNSSVVSVLSVVQNAIRERTCESRPGRPSGRGCRNSGTCYAPAESGWQRRRHAGPCGFRRTRALSTPCK